VKEDLEKTNTDSDRIDTRQMEVEEEGGLRTRNSRLDFGVIRTTV